MAARHVTKKGARFVARFEGFLSCPYWDQYGQVWTIGYGETQGIGPHTRCWSKRKARRDLHRRLNHQYNPARLLPHIDFKQCEVNALASLAYNNGPGILTDPSFSTLARRLHSHEAHSYWHRCRIYEQELPKWVKSGGQTLPGLVTRRHAEVRLACTGHYH